MFVYMYMDLQITPCKNLKSAERGYLTQSKQAQRKR